MKPLGPSTKLTKSPKHLKTEEAVVSLKAAMAAAKKDALATIYARDSRLNETAQGCQQAEEHRIKQVSC